VRNLEALESLRVVSNEQVFKEAAKRMREIYFLKNKKHLRDASLAFVFNGDRIREIVELDYETLYEMQSSQNKQSHK